MIIAGLKKELMLVSRGFRFWGLLILAIGIAIAYPGLYKFIEVMAEAASQMGAGAGAEAADSLKNMVNELTTLYGGEMIKAGYYTGILAFSAEGFLVISLLLMATAGGEQKKRSVIMPNCAGLTPAGYVLPKFILYPLLTGVLTFAGAQLTAVFSGLMFKGTLPMDVICFSGGCISFYVMFMTAVFFLFGIATGRPGIGVVVMFLVSSLLPTLLQAFGLDYGTPFTLRDMFMTTMDKVDMGNFWVSVAVTITLIVICCLLTLVITTVRKIDNSEGEANL